MERLKFTHLENHPYDGCITFTFEHSKDISANPQNRKQYVKGLAEVTAWCELQFGPPGFNAPWDYSFVGVYYFDDPEKAFEFRLRWC
ncbi:MAG: hypothetical protein EOO77_35635 [Oxalobacteraceae bacterium]|nr:MAG: hypothetical protein EOO77_35635 [Oxalobacteraceae bacterium]